MKKFNFPTNAFRALATAVAVCTLTVLVGCAGPAPNYAPAIDNVESLKKLGSGNASVGTISANAEAPGIKSIGLRANTMVSPVGAHYGDYLAAALKQELELAKLYDAKSQTEISGRLLRNVVDASGFSVGTGRMEAQFLVKRSGATVFDKVVGANHQWESSFAGAVAIPMASSNYPVMVQKLIAALIADPDFKLALRP